MDNKDKKIVGYDDRGFPIYEDNNEIEMTNNKIELSDEEKDKKYKCYMRVAIMLMFIGLIVGSISYPLIIVLDGETSFGALMGGWFISEIIILPISIISLSMVSKCRKIKKSWLSTIITVIDILLNWALILFILNLFLLPFAFANLD